jgi:hypothetical protein
MRWIRQLQFLALTCVLSASAAAATLKDPVAARTLTDRVMIKVGDGDAAAGLQLMQPFIIVPPAEFDVMRDQLKLQEPMMAQRFGKSIGQEFIREDKIGDSLMRIVYLHRFEKHAMRWNFYFYRGTDGWVLNTFRTDDDVAQLFAM